MNSTSSPLQKGAMRGVWQVLRQLVGAEGAHADARRPPVQVQVGNSVEHLGLPWRRLLELSRPHLQSSLPGSILSSRNSRTHAGTALNCTLQGGLMQLVLGRPFSTVVHDQDKSI